MGDAGEKISSFVKLLDERHGQQLEKLMQDILGDKFTDLRAQTKEKPGWMQLLIRESYSNKSMDVDTLAAKCPISFATFQKEFKYYIDKL